LMDWKDEKINAVARTNLTGSLEAADLEDRFPGRKEKAHELLQELHDEGYVNYRNRVATITDKGRELVKDWTFFQS
ncbi:MAG: hypothetical protein ACYC4H_12285, partial [Desulfocucumaceae bacterium]